MKCRPLYLLWHFFCYYYTGDLSFIVFRIKEKIYVADVIYFFCFWQTLFSFFEEYCWRFPPIPSIISCLTSLLKCCQWKNALYSYIISPIARVPAETCSFLVFPLLVRLPCLTVHFSGCPTEYGGVWLGSRSLWAVGRHPLWLPAWLMSLCLVFGVILNCCGAVSHEP